MQHEPNHWEYQRDAIILVVTLLYASINDLKIHIYRYWSHQIKRYDSNQKILNLAYFHLFGYKQNCLFHLSDYCPNCLSSELLIIFWSWTKTPIAVIKHLQYNELFNLSAIKNSNLTSIKYLDLGHNILLNVDILSPLKNLKVVKLWLDGNLLCKNYSTANQYIESRENITRICKN